MSDSAAQLEAEDPEGAVGADPSLIEEDPNLIDLDAEIDDGLDDEDDGALDFDNETEFTSPVAPERAVPLKSQSYVGEILRLAFSITRYLTNDELAEELGGSFRTQLQGSQG